MLRLRREFCNIGERYILYRSSPWHSILGYSARTTISCRRFQRHWHEINPISLSLAATSIPKQPEFTQRQYFHGRGIKGKLSCWKQPTALKDSTGRIFCRYTFGECFLPPAATPLVSYEFVISGPTLRNNNVDIMVKS